MRSLIITFDEAKERLFKKIFMVETDPTSKAKKGARVESDPYTPMVSVFKRLLSVRSTTLPCKNKALMAPKSQKPKVVRKVEQFKP